MGYSPSKEIENISIIVIMHPNKTNSSEISKIKTKTNHYYKQLPKTGTII